MTKEYEGVAATTSPRLQVLRNYVEQLTVSIGMPLLGAIKDLVAVAGPFMTTISAWINAHPDIVRAIAAAAVGLFALRVGLLGARFALQPLILSDWGFRWVLGAATWALGSVIGLLPALGRALMMLLSPMALVRGTFVALRFAVIASGVGAIMAGSDVVMFDSVPLTTGRNPGVIFGCTVVSIFSYPEYIETKRLSVRLAETRVSRSIYKDICNYLFPCTYRNIRMPTDQFNNDKIFDYIQNICIFYNKINA